MSFPVKVWVKSAVDQHNFPIVNHRGKPLWHSTMPTYDDIKRRQKSAMNYIMRRQRV